MIEWDLSISHTTADVDWPKPDLTAVEISPVESVEIRLPAGRRFSGDGELVHDVTLDRRGDLLRGPDRLPPADARPGGPARRALGR
jgi:hypothetical protein